MTAELEPPPRPPLGRALSAFGAVIILVLVLRRMPWDPSWAGVAAVASSLLWLAHTLLPRRAPRRLRRALLVAAAVTGAPTGVPTQVTGLVPALVAVVTLIADPARSAVLAIAVPLAVAALVGLGSLVTGGSVGVLVGCLAGLVLAAVVGISRAQTRVAEQQSRLLLEQQLLVEQERTRSAALAERSRIARDLHDVLAQSLGGLVLQLDAVDALLDAGRVTEASERVRAARGLAGDGLEEARSAVDALREPDDAADLPRTIGDLIDLHRSLGGSAELTVTGVPGPLRAESAGALRRAAQEVLSNARRHAPGEHTHVVLGFEPDTAALGARTPLTDRAAGTGGAGRGLTGLRDRAVAAGGEASWRLADGGFVVDVRVPR